MLLEVGAIEMKKPNELLKETHIFVKIGSSRSG